jgi:colanic acid biosynthesis glycosyl transferase WcaI
MKILVCGCYFTPDPIGGGKFTGEMAEWLAERGHEVRAVMAPPFYPQWKVAEGYSGLRYQKENLRGVTILRCPVYVPAHASGARRLLQYALFALSSAPAIWSWAISWKPDIVWSMAPPLAASVPALMGARLAGARSWLHVQDFEIDAAFELGLLRAPAVRRLLLGAERRLMSAFDIASSITPKMVSLLETKGVTAPKILFPNWVDLDAIHPLPDNSGLRDELDIPRGAFVALYSGNLGEKQGVDDLVQVARLLRDVPDFLMIVCGDGTGRARLASQAGDLANIRFLPLQPMEVFNRLLGMADVHLLPQKAEIADLVMPSKLPGMLASGRPVVAGAQAEAQLAQEVAGCGAVVPPGDPVAMADAVRRLMTDEAARRALGAAAARRAAERWSKMSILLRFERELMKLAAHGCSAK